MASSSAASSRCAEAGKSWTKLPDARAPVLRVLFADENNGWAVCGNKTVLKTHDGARHWSSVRAAAEPPGDPRSSVYRWSAFATPQAGLILGSINPPPSGSLALGATGGGQTWKSVPGSIFGELTLARFGGAGTGLGLIEHAP